jgi:M6 family metalloprotease-like protein
MRHLRRAIAAFSIFVIGTTLSLQNSRVMAGYATPHPQTIGVESVVQPSDVRSCRSEGRIKNTSAGKFRCTKLGGRTVWRRMRSTPTNTTKVPLHTDPTISGSESLLDISSCRIPDVSIGGTGSSGFPRPESVRSDRGQVDVLVIPVGFTDLPFSERDSASLKGVFSRVSRYYEAMSYDHASISTTIAPEDSWVVLDETLEQNGLINTPPQYDASNFFRRVVELYSQSNDAEAYDVVSVVSAFSHRFGLAQAHASGASIYGTNRSFSGMMMLGRYAASWDVFAHELGHAWLGFEDLYVFGGGVPLGGWDLMSSAGTEMSGWSRFLAGWIDDNRVRCVKPRIKSRHYLASLNAGRTIEQPRALVVPISSHAALVVELRTPGEWVGVDRPYVIVYRVDTSINHGEGPIRFVGLVSRVGAEIVSNSVRVSLASLGDAGVIVEVDGVAD